MISVVALSAVTGGINLAAGAAEVRELGFAGGSEVSGERMETVRRALERRRGGLPVPNSGGSVANTADLIAHTDPSCTFMGVGETMF